MSEKVYRLARTDGKTIEKVLLDENLHYLHMVLGPDDGLPEHNTNGNVYMTVVRGGLSIALGGEEMREYSAGALLKIPKDVKMNVKNRHRETLELIVVKAPAPGI